MRKTAQFVFCGLALLLAACSNNNVEPPAPLAAIVPTLDVQEVWSHSIGDSDAVLHLGIVPVSDGTNVYTATADGKVVAYNLASGSQLWKLDTDLDFTAGPGLGNGELVLTGRDGKVLALNAASGKKLWEVDINAAILAPPAVGDSAVILHATSSHIIALAPDSGNRLWNVSREPTSLSLRGNAPPVIVNGHVYIGLNSGKLLSLNLADGSQHWEYTVSSPTGGDDLSRLTDLDGNIAYDSGVVYAVTYQGKVAAVSADSGQPQWSRELSSYTGVSTDAQHVYVSDVHGAVWALNKQTGVPDWTQPALRARDVTLPVPYAGTVVVGDLKGYLHFLSAADGRFVARVRLDSDPIQAPPVVAGNYLVALSTGGELAVYRVVQSGTGH